MAFLYITEYEHVAQAAGGNMNVGRELAVATQVVAIGGGSLQSAAFNIRTKMVRLHSDAICSISFGTNPTATTSTPRMAANQTEYFGVAPESSLKVAVITNT